ncbi:hypothetical protein EK69_004572 [Salmonella enterica subsp. enterica]|nr:hypothetical protein [Salmonella enterica subsp. enterica serovar Baguida]
MQTISLVISYLKLVALVYLIFNSALAKDKYSFFVEGDELYVLNFPNPNDRSLVPLAGDHTSWTIIDTFKKIKSDTYFAVFQKEPSNPEYPEGFCGSGMELWLHVYKLNKSGVSLTGVILASSCKESFAMASLESGSPGSDSDYSSFKWSDVGFSIEWFSKIDKYGKNISKTFYFIKGDNIYSKQ